ncbi:ABC transporter permease [Planotetraspora thailandica]|uniref:ABC transporter permease n=1 Tax=Planotetraspora thailandica TaxID=487172 RepID=A0A8J3V4R2_9ACTN|nr:ABC transporter permease [Planotetraspora thailandica]GII56065.1 ABC transporter permease [Planotetraspora thailandica]
MPFARLVEPTRLKVVDVVAEALAAVLARPGRAALTALGTLLGVASFVAVLGLTSTASGQISAEFTKLEATQVTVEDVAANPQPNDIAFPDNAEQRVKRINGVNAAGVYWTGRGADHTVSARPGVARSDATQGIQVYAASPGFFKAIHAHLATGRTYDAFAENTQQRVCVLGVAAARELGISDVEQQPAVFVDGKPFTVLGIFDDAERIPESLLGVFIPDRSYTAAWGSPKPGTVAAHMVIDTRLGAADVVGDQVQVALRPDEPTRFQVNVPLSPKELTRQVNNQLQGLFLLLALICLAVGAVGIANTTLVAVLERVGEIGLRRSLGARPRHIAAHFLAESAALGLLGAMAGTSLGVVTVVAVAWVKSWTPLLDPVIVLPAPLVGGVMGLLAGVYPAWRASRIEPTEALRR